MQLALRHSCVTWNLSSNPGSFEFWISLPSIVVLVTVSRLGTLAKRNFQFHLQAKVAEETTRCYITQGLYCGIMGEWKIEWKTIICRFRV